MEKEDELKILTKELKQRKDYLTEFENAGRNDLIEKIEKEINILQNYMPEQLTENEIEEMVKTTISEVNATSKKEFGKVMGALMTKDKGKAEGGVGQKMVQKH